MALTPADPPECTHTAQKNEMAAVSGKPLSFTVLASQWPFHLVTVGQRAAGEHEVRVNRGD